MTPSATASMPVSATAPDENARSTRSAVNGTTGSATSPTAGAGAPDHAYRTKPTPSRSPKAAMNRYDGRAKSRPDSRSPRRLPRAMSAIATTQTMTRWSNSIGTAEVMAATPAEMLTATVSV